MAEKKIGLNFFQLIPSGNLANDEYKENFNAIRRAFVSVPQITNFTPLPRADSNVSVHGKIKNNVAGYLLGTLINNQMLDIPPSYDSKTRELSPLTLADTQGLGYPTSFLFDYQANILMIESVRSGVGLAAFCKFFKQNLDTPSFDSSVIINPADLQKFERMSVIKSFEVKVARVENGEIFNNGKSKSVSQIIDAADNTNTNTLVYKLTASRKESLKPSKIRNFVSGFLKYKDSEEVQVLKVTGREDDEGASFPIDFIQQRLKDFITMERERLIGNFYIEETYKKMEEVYHKHRQSLLSAYKLKK